MARILIVTSHLTGMVHAAAVLAQRLAGAGHAPAFAAPEAARATVGRAGIPFHEIPVYPLNPVVAGLPPFRTSDLFGARRRARLSASIARFSTESLPPVIDRVKPDLVLVDAELHAHAITALGAGRRTALLTSMMPGLVGPASPPMSYDRVPGSGLRRGPAGVGALWLRHWAARRHAALRARISEGGADVASALRAHARSQGVDLRAATTAWGFAAPWTWSRLPLIVMGPREWDLPAPIPARVRYVGPMLDPARSEDSLVADFLPKREGPLIYVAFGSLRPHSSGFVARLWQALGALPQASVLFVRGPMPPEALPGHRPSNLEVIEWAPQPALMRRADLWIGKAGANSITEAILGDARILLYPDRMVDQPGNAARVAYHGLGHVGRTSDDAATMGARIRTALADPKAPKCSMLMRTALSRYVIDRVAEQEIDRLLVEAPTR